MFGRGSGMNVGGPDVGGTMPESSFFGFRFQKCPAAADNYVRCDAAGDYFLDQMMRWLQGWKKKSENYQNYYLKIHLIIFQNIFIQNSLLKQKCIFLLN